MSIIPCDKPIVEKHERYVEIYEITCEVTGKKYVGQTVSHVLNTGKYRKYGMEKRLKCHISEAFSTKKNQCHYLNNAIRKYGSENFTVKLLDICSIENSDDKEAEFIVKNNTMFPSGYNLKLGTKTTRLSDEGRRRVSAGLVRYFSERKFDRFLVDEDITPIDFDEVIKPAKKAGKQYGWYVYINRKKADFGGIHISLEDSLKMAQDFIYELQKRKIAKYLDAGESLKF